MRKALRISVSILLFAIAVAITQIPVNPVSADTSVSTEADFQIKDSILVKYTGTAKVVSVPAYVSKIGDEAFMDHDEIEEVQFQGDKLEEIAYCAFAGCDNLQKVVLPDSLYTLGNGAFSRCASLKEAKIGKGLKNIGIGCFANSPNLSVLTVDAKNPNFIVRDGCLYDDESKKLFLVLPGRSSDTFVIPSTVEDVDAYAFWGSKEIKSVSLGSKLRYIPDYAFSNCKALEEVVIPLSVRRIGIKAFEDCVRLKKVVIPVSVTEIHPTAFDGCKHLEIFADEGTYAYRFYQDYLLKHELSEEEENEQIIHVEEPETIVENGYYDPDKDNILGGTFVVGNSAIIFIDSAKLNKNDGSSNSGTKDENKEEDENPIEKNKEVPKFSITENGIIADYTFYKNKMAEYEFEENTKEIGRFAFARSGLTKIHIPVSVTTIDYGAFYHCDSLKNVFIPASVKKIAPKAFDHTPWFTEWKEKDGEDFLIVGDGILLGYRGRESAVTIPDSVKVIGSFAFADNHFLSSVMIPDSVVTIEENAFYNCTNLSLLEGGEKVTRIEDEAFRGCNFHEFHVKDSVKELGYAPVSCDVLVFDSKEELPKAIYTETKTYLNKDTSDAYLGDVKLVVLDKKFKLNDLGETILSRDKNLINGVVLSLDEEKNEARVLFSGYSKEEYERNTIVSGITLNDNEITVLGTSDVEEFAQTDYKADSLQIRNGSDFVEEIKVSLDGAKGNYTLEVKDDTNYEDIKKAYKNVYRMELKDKLPCIDFTLLENGSKILKKNFADYNVEIRVKIPNIYNNSTLRVLTIDDNGQLENVSYKREDGMVVLAAKHFSKYVFCADEKEDNLYGQAHVYGGQSTILNMHKLDASPDTGDYIHPKYFVALAVFALGVANLLVKRRKKKGKAV